MILPLRFLNKERLLFHEVSLTVLTFERKDEFAHVILPSFYFALYVFPLFSDQLFGNFNIDLTIRSMQRSRNFRKNREHLASREDNFFLSLTKIY